MYTSVFVTVIIIIIIRLYHGECDISNPARGHTVLPEKLLFARSLKKGNDSALLAFV